MKNSASKKHLLVKHIGMIVVFFCFVLFVYHHSSAEEAVDVPVLENEGGTNSEEPQSPDVSSEEEISETIVTQQDSEEVSIEEVIETLQTEEVSENPIPLQANSIDAQKENTPLEEIFMEEAEEEQKELDFEIPFFIPRNLPEVRILPEALEAEIDEEALHSCSVRDFSVDLSILPNKNNLLVVTNPTLNSANMEIVGLPRGLEIIFTKTKDSAVSVATGQSEIPFTIKKGGDIQKGNFNVVFLFTRKIGSKESTTTCQMNVKL